ncbi:MAG TPA: redoxin family protein [Candidatus Angelobacter sp.]|nr:redoxin family protein [Candidatus Angelobacter sp.]
MVITLTLAALVFLNQTHSNNTDSHFSSPSQAWAYANGPAAEWDADVAAGKTPKSHFRPSGVTQERAKTLCPQFALESTSGEELYWLAKLCESGGAFPKGLSAAERYLTLPEATHGPDARLELSILQMRVSQAWETSWPTLRTILQEDPIESKAEVLIRTAIEEEADKNEATALGWSQERYSLLLERENNPKPESPAVPYVWIFTAGGDLVHRYYLAGEMDKATALVAELNQLKDAHPQEMRGWAADSLYTANMEMKPAPQIPVLKAVGRPVGADLVQKGRVEVVHFMFLRCPPCITDLRYLDEFEKRYRKENVLVANLTTYQSALQPDNPPHNSVEAALNKARHKRSPHLTMAVAPEQTLADYQITAFPVIAVIDKTGRLRYVGQSRGFDEGEELDRLVRKLLAE